MSKAFDKVSHTKLLVRLREFGFAGSILKWFGSYLTSRYQQTTILGGISRLLPVSSGVPQGSILGLLLFLLYENHLSNDVTNSRIATFADDTKIFKTINSKSDALSLQNDLSNFHESSSSVNLELNNTKCKVLRVTRRHNKLTYPYKLNNTILESTDCEWDLGILTSSTLTWSQQVDYLCNKATKMLGYVRRSTLNINDTIVRRRLYLCLVHSQLCYGSQIWAPQSVALVKRMESLQRRATKYILNLPFRCDTTYNERLALLDLPLCYWHKFLDMVTFYKLTHGIMTIDNNLLQPSPDNNNNRRETTSFDLNHLSFTAAQCRTSTYQRSFLNRMKKI